MVIFTLYFFFSNQASLVPPLFFPLRPYANQGFTAVVLCYDRVDTMFKVITKIADTPSLTKVSYGISCLETSVYLSPVRFYR